MRHTHARPLHISAYIADICYEASAEMLGGGRDTAHSLLRRKKQAEAGERKLKQSVERMKLDDECLECFQMALRNGRARALIFQADGWAASFISLTVILIRQLFRQINPSRINQREGKKQKIKKQISDCWCAEQHCAALCRFPPSGGHPLRRQSVFGGGWGGALCTG